ncbi:PadR family transcriptional regulator [Clostridium estertheticum]|uniref:Helix-turn-helix transcriptional regulator n=1 Tax=Clostridium estertheticum TaxID=238834 RepID=A0A7Y3SXZ1_9CLOT|nr:PadR family transcriptional regulator [Clostridium estertheticum]MBW9171387.1 PadR family transcriptional regulator [Clostridium estertheticum]NNU77441.1 helix-turn-helix transcriptional regulator [Clostridium estertheticum]WBL48610.1 PadR family transcriptional regulator [Clostridium estertheticum]WLC76698.1 PadR family transcriptional regulator [Clostridium estertheticum]
MPINKELLKGSTVILILKLINKKPMYGYEMIKEMEEKSNGIFTLKEGTLYPILHTLESKGLVESYWDESSSKRKRKYYRIMDQGKLSLKEKEEEWSTFRTAVDNMLLEVVIWA